jgi:hypothetical protein
MSGGAVNLLVLLGIVAIVAAAGAITYRAATSRGGRKSGKPMKTSQAAKRKVNPKTGDMFP